MNPSDDYSKFSPGDSPGMKVMIIACLLQMPGRRGDIRSVKGKMMEMFGERIKREFVEKTRASSHLQEWEKTILKTFSRHKNIFIKNKAVFCASPPLEDTARLSQRDETMEDGGTWE